MLGSTDEIDHEISSNPKQPITKSTSCPIGIPTIDSPSHGGQHLLNQLVRVSILKPLPASHAIEKGLVYLHEFIPGLDVLRVG
jgi:hypothetical protein